MKQKLQEVTEYKVMSAQECCDALGWSYTDSGDTLNDISCPCGGEITMSGFIGTDQVECRGCGKFMIDLFSPIPISSSTCAILDPDKFELDEVRHWIAIDNNGGIKEANNVNNEQSAKPQNT